ncbi:B3 domain-containing protein REM17-like [Solanum stenotomum]|uniref:B3 domain-containing protein REM17-like n=1 Tax=Solanum stenotomum TaxID=172797 RepID=UPI0020D1AB36|nr:B3 domain-containing protein REM17-like [Solanum stenotomum]
MEIPPKKPHFFKPILPGFKNGLKIPIGFLKYLKGHDQHEHAILTRGGKKWLVKANGRRLEEGSWKEFVEELNLKLGDVLVFKHEGDMKFDVSIFDSSHHCDKEYAKYEDEDEDEDENVTHDKHLSQSYFECTIRQYCLSKGFMWIPKHFAVANGFIKGNKKYGLIIIDETQTKLWNLMLKSCNTKVYVADGWGKFSADNCLKEGDRIMFEVVTNGETPIWRSRVTSNAETPISKGLCNKEAAKDMDLSDSHFICTIRPYCLSKHFLCIPKQFAVKNRLNDRKYKIIVMDKQRSWTFNVYTNSQYTYIGSGWREFCITNCLKEGDRLMFEIVSKGETPIFRIHDLRGSSSLQPEVKKKKSKAKRTLMPQVSGSDANSHFISTIKPYTINNPVLYLPMDFVKSNGLMRRREMILINEKRRSWSVWLRKTGHHFAIKRGWTQFRNANGIQVGDTYKFELTNNGTIPIVHFHCKYSGN